MRSLYFLMSCIILNLCIIACKKDHSVPSENTSIDSLHQSVIYKTVAIVPSPADTANGTLNDSLSVYRNVGKNDPDFFTNIPNVSSNIVTGYGFSFGYDDPNKSLPYFTFTAYAFPGVPHEFLLNYTYEHNSSPSDGVYQRPMFLGTHTGYGGMTYFVNNSYPPDADFISSKTYSKVIFTKKLKIPNPLLATDTLLFGSGHISGYCIDYYKSTDTAKYKHRWDFTVDFSDLKIDK